ncbi:MAG: hypothetical protein HYU67_04015 [Flavobacteriia bacterium]|nr:hypothetical protein [Flavobacteriia bacterium]
MKKTIYLLCICGLTLVSCKKTLTCDCNVTIPNTPTENFKHTIKGCTKKTAQKECENIEYNQDQIYRNQGGSYICDLR